jgi:exodeoxyribonuclease VII large subunit
MPEKLDNKTIFSLHEVTKSIQQTLSERYKSSFWVKAEMNKLNYYKQSGHCYPELVEKQNGKVIAQIKSCLWKEDYIRSNEKFQAILKEPLKDGIKILFLAKITFDPAHGLSLLIMDIDPSYTLGDLEREKQETIKKLRDEGIFDRNRTLKLPALPQRIAIISVETSKGFADFRKIIETNPWQYKFFNFLFPSLLQGDKAISAISYQLKRILTVRHHFDVVAIIRGGGGDVGLSCYNNYQLAKEIATFPIPVITGIGHATNETVVEMISFYNAITPTKLAEYLLQKFHNFSIPVQEAERKIHDRSKRFLNEEKTKFQSEIKLFRSLTENIIIVNKNEVSILSKSLHQNSNYILRAEKERLSFVQNEMIRSTHKFSREKRTVIKQYATTLSKDIGSKIIHSKLFLSRIKENLALHSLQLFKNKRIELNSTEKNLSNMNPENVVRRGYSITLLNGKSIGKISQLQKGDTIETTVSDGKIVSTVESLNKKENE